MLEGAIIGGIVGLIMATILIVKQARKKKQIIAVIEDKGPEAGKAALDKAIPPLKKIPLTKLLDQRERMAGLALVDDQEALEREIDEHTGELTAVAQVNAIGLLALAVRKDAKDGARRLDELATKMENEGGRLLALVKKKTRALAILAMGLTGVEIPEEHWKTIEGISNESGMVQLLLWQAISLALKETGKPNPALAFEKRVLQVTRAFK